PGIGQVNYGTSNEVGLDYNSLQLSVQRRLSHGLQMGMAYTLSKGEGMRGWDYVTEELYGAAGLRARYYGPQLSADTGLERRHAVCRSRSATAATRRSSSSSTTCSTRWSTTPWVRRSRSRLRMRPAALAAATRTRAPASTRARRTRTTRRSRSGSTTRTSHVK